MTWGDHRVAFKRHTARCGWPDPQPVPLTKPVDFTGTDTIVHFQRDDAGRTNLYVSDDRGGTWRGPHNNIPEFLDGVHGRTDYEATGPRSLAAYMEMADKPANGSTRIRSHAVFTADAGLTWTLGQEISALSAPGTGRKVEWDTHPSVARIDANTLVASFCSGHQNNTRDRTGWFDLTRSMDNGQSWSHLVRLGESPGNNSCPASTVVVSMSGGRKRLVTLMWLRPPDRNSGARSRLLARFSDDRGDTWSPIIVLRQDALGWDTGYPIATVRPDGKIVVCYWMKTVSQDEPNYIATTIWDARGPIAR